MNVRNADRVESRASQTNRISKKVCHSYDANFKLMVVREAENTNNCRAALKYGILEKNVCDWGKMKQKLKSTCSTRRSFRGPESGKNAELDNQVAAFVLEKRTQGFVITREVIELKGLEIARSMNIPRIQFKASMEWCKRMMRRYGLTLQRKTTLAHRLLIDFEKKKLLEYQRFVLKLRKEHSYLLSQMGNC